MVRARELRKIGEMSPSKPYELNGKITLLLSIFSVLGHSLKAVNDY